jgi:hypothetical protein
VVVYDTEAEAQAQADLLAARAPPTLNGRSNSMPDQVNASQSHLTTVSAARGVEVMTVLQGVGEFARKARAALRNEPWSVDDKMAA